jgi:translation elongation factor EF-1beta
MIGFFCPSDIAKSFIIFDIKPWSSETDIDAMEKAVRTIEANGLLWGQCKSIEKRIVYFDCYLFLFIAKQVPVAFGLHKLEIACVIEDDKVRNKKKFFSSHYCLFIYTL